MRPEAHVSRLATSPYFLLLRIHPPVAPLVVVPSPGVTPAPVIGLDLGAEGGPEVFITVPTDSAPRAPSTGRVGVGFTFPLRSADEHSEVVPLEIIGCMRV